MTTKRQAHLDRMAADSNLTPDVRERFRVAADDLRGATARVTRDDLMETLYDTLAENVPPLELRSLANVFDGYRTRFARSFAAMSPLVRELFDAIVDAADFATEFENGDGETVAEDAR